MDPWLIWLVAAAVLGLGETLSGDFVLLMLGAGALGGSATAALGGPLWLQVLVFALVSVVLIGAVRPVARRHLLASTSDPVTGTRALEGRRAEVLEAVSGDAGLVRIGGDEWTARPSVPGQRFAVGTPVFVDRIDGATALVIEAI